MEDIIRREIRRIVKEELDAERGSAPPAQQGKPARMVLLTEEQVSEWLEVPVSTLRDWRQKQINIPFIPLSDRKARYSEEAVNNYLQSIEVQVEQ